MVISCRRLRGINTRLLSLKLVVLLFTNMFAHRNTLDPSVLENHTEHQGKKVGLANKETARQLKVCTGEFALWAGGDEKMAVAYEDLAEFAWSVAEASEDLDGLIWHSHFSQPAALERVLGPAFAKVEKKVYNTKPEFMAALGAARDKLSDKERATATISAADLHTALRGRHGGHAGAERGATATPDTRTTRDMLAPRMRRYGGNARSVAGGHATQAHMSRVVVRVGRLGRSGIQNNRAPMWRDDDR